MRVKQHIYSLDTEPLEVVMNLISIQDRPFFDKMYPNTRGGEFLAKIAYDHRKLDENLDENKDDEKKRMKGAKLKLKMGDALDEAVADLFVKKGDVNKIAVKIAKSAKGLGLKSGVMGNQVRVKGSQKNVNDFMRAVIGKSSLGGPSEVGASNPQIDKMLDKQLKKETINEKKQAGYIAMYGDKKVEIPLNKAKDLYTAKQIAIKMMNVPKSKQGLLSINPAYEETIKEDGHTDVSSAVRQCKTIVEDATQMMGKLQSMSGEDSLPTWWTNKLAVASNSMNKIRDYLLVPSMQNERMEKSIDKLPRQFLNPSKEVMVIKKNKVIVIDKKDQDKYTKQGWELAEKQIDEIKKASLQFSLGMNSDMMKAKKDLEKKGHKVKVSGNKMTVTAKSGSDIDRELSDIRNFYDRGVKIKAEQIEETPMTFSQKVQEQIGEFEREIYLAENNIDVIKSVVKSKGAKNLKMKDGKMMVDLFSASAIMNVYNKVNPNNKKKMEKLANGTRADLGKLQRLAMKFA